MAPAARRILARVPKPRTALPCSREAVQFPGSAWRASHGRNWGGPDVIEAAVRWLGASPDGDAKDPRRCPGLGAGQARETPNHDGAEGRFACDLRRLPNYHSPAPIAAPLKRCSQHSTHDLSACGRGFRQKLGGLAALIEMPEANSRGPDSTLEPGRGRRWRQPATANREASARAQLGGVERERLLPVRDHGRQVWVSADAAAARCGLAGGSWACGAARCPAAEVSESLGGVAVAMAVPGGAALSRPGHEGAPEASFASYGASARRAERGASGWAHKASELPCPSSFVCNASARGRLRSAHDSGAPRTSRRANDNDLHPCAQP